MSQDATQCEACGRLLPRHDTDDWEPYVPSEGESIAVIGITRHGKSSFLKRWAAYLLEQGKPVVAWDLADEYSQEGVRRENTDLGPLAERVTVSEFLAAPEVIRRRKLSLAVVPDDLFADKLEHAEQFRAFAPWVRRGRAEGCHFFIDEVGQIAEHAEGMLDDIAERWAKDGVVPYFAGQRWTHLPVGVRAEVHWLFGFKQVKPSDLAQLARDAGREFAQALAHLERGQFRVANLREPHRDALASLNT